MGIYYSDDGRFVTDTLDFLPQTYLTQKGIIDTENCIIDTENCRNYIFRKK